MVFGKDLQAVLQDTVRIFRDQSSLYLSLVCIFSTVNVYRKFDAIAHTTI